MGIFLPADIHSAKYPRVRVNRIEKVGRQFGTPRVCLVHRDGTAAVADTAHYTFLILLLPVVLLLQTAPFVQRVLLVVWFTLLTLNLPFPALFPKVWLLLLLYAACGFRYWRSGAAALDDCHGSRAFRDCRIS